MKPFVLGIAGGSGSGKTTLARAIHKQVGEAVLLFQDYYYRDQSAHFRGDGSINFDHPDAIEFLLLVDHLKSLKAESGVWAPNYDFSSHTRQENSLWIDPRPLVILDGILILSQEAVRSSLDLSVFIHAPEDLRLSRRLKRDVEERGRTSEGVREQFQRHVKPMHDLFVEPSQNFADLVLSGTQDLQEKVNQVLKRLRSKGFGFDGGEPLG